ncbi:hypothetical protein BH09SUM1_BH09SUM1_08860 [soil metagenome]
MEADATHSPAIAPPVLRIKVVRPQHPERSASFDAYPVQFGRGSASDVMLEDANISRLHAEIYLKDGALCVRDLKSLNGIRLNGVNVEDAPVMHGDVLAIGDSEITLLLNPADDTPRRQSEEFIVMPDGATGVLEIIRAIDLGKVSGRNATAGADWSAGLSESAETSAQQVKLHLAYNNLLVIMNLLSQVGSHSHPQQICAQFAAALKRVFSEVENIAIVEVSAAKDTAPRVAYQEWNVGPASLSQPSRTVMQRVIDETRAVYAVDARDDPRYSKSESMQARGVRSMMCAPLVARGEVIGAVYAENLTQPYCFSQFDLGLLTVFAFHLGIAMETARLLEERDKAFERAAISVKAAKQDKNAMIVQYSQSEKKFRALFEQSALGAAVINLVTQHVEEVNDGLVRMLGYTRRQLAGMHFREMLTVSEQPNVETWLRAVRDNGEGSFKVHLRNSSNQTIVALQSCRALRLGENQVMVAYFIDITAKEHAEEATRTQLKRVTALSELSQALMTTMDPEAIHELLFKKIASVLSIDHLFIALVSPEDQQLRIMFSARKRANGNFELDFTTRAVPGMNAYVERVIENRESLLHTAPSVALTPDDSDPFDFPDGSFLNSALFVPMASRGRLNGVVCAQTTVDDAYDDSHLETLRALVAQAALAMSNAKAFEDIRGQQESLRQLSVQIMTTQETERGRISRELHDGVGQQLTAMKYMLEGVRNAAKASDEEKLLERIGEARELATQIIDDLRTISLDLRPTMLDDLGLGPTLDWFTRQFAARYGVEVIMNYEVVDEHLPPEVSTATFRIIQEALGNVAKHARATHVDIGVSLMGGVLRIAVEDDGVGFKANTLPTMQAARGCSGMLNMKERAHFLGGEFRLETSPGKGAKLMLKIPVQEAAR